MSSLRESSKNSGYSECLTHTGPECLHSFKMGVFGNKDLLHKTQTLAHTLEGKNTCQNPGNIFNNFSIIFGRLKAYVLGGGGGGVPYHLQFLRHLILSKILQSLLGYRYSLW